MAGTPELFTLAAMGRHAKSIVVVNTGQEHPRELCIDRGTPRRFISSHRPVVHRVSPACGGDWDDDMAPAALG
jgi:hypothetical protein